MFRATLVVLTFCSVLRAEVHSMTLRQTIETGLRQNPDVALARFDEEKARQAIRVARGPFSPRVTVGSGLAYSDGFPLSIEGSAPSIVQGQAAQYIFNRPQSYAVAQAREDARGASLTVASKRDEVAYRIATLYLDAERAARIGALARKDTESQEKVLESIRAQVAEGRALPLAEKTAMYNLARTRQIADGLEDEQETAETSLAIGLGFPAEDRVRPIEEERTAPQLPQSEEQAIQTALESNKDLRRLESQVVAKELERRGERASRLPRVDLVAQYGLFAKFNNYQEFFQRFQRNNGQIGVSFQLPLLLGTGVSAQVAQTDADISHLKLELTSTRNRLTADLQQSFRAVKRAGTASEVSRLDLEVAREQLSVTLAQMQEGRATMRQVEEARIVENQKWIAFYDAQYAVEKARWNVLRLTGELVAQLDPPR
ncbi:MAG TPA: TolC family protein [Bryobacteraceae bacterium]|nr:TolC family protein [Bryobacteraceae bacterium]